MVINVYQNYDTVKVVYTTGLRRVFYWVNLIGVDETVEKYY